MALWLGSRESRLLSWKLWTRAIGLELSEQKCDTRPVMLLVLRDYTKISTERTMDGPQTRKEKKGGKGGKGVYSAKHVRLTAALIAGAGAGPRVPSNAGGHPKKR